MDNEQTDEIKTALGRIADEAKTRVDELRAELREAEQKFSGTQQDRANYGGGGEAKFLICQDGTRLPLLRKDQRFSEFCPATDDGFSLAKFARAAVLGGEKAASGPALVPGFLSSQIIDDVRAATVLVEAGSQTIRIDGPTTLAKLGNDPTIYVHTESAPDILESDLTVLPIVVNPKLLAALIPLSVELVEDSPNLDALLQEAISAAFATKADALNLAMILADASIPKSLAGQDPAAWASVLAAISNAMAADQRAPLAYISNPADFIARSGQLASTSGSWLGKPPSLATMLELTTSAMPLGSAVFGDFARGFAVIIRSDLRLEVVRHGKPESGEHLLVCHARIGGLVLQPSRLFKQLKTVV
jgi:HK97 family phage major capsid protein